MCCGHCVFQGRLCRALSDSRMQFVNLRHFLYVHRIVSCGSVEAGVGTVMGLYLNSVHV